MVGGFHGMLLLSAKHSRTLVWWEDTLWKAVRNTIQRPSSPVWSNGRISPCFCKRPVATTSISSLKFCQVYALDRYVLSAGGIWKRDILVAGIEDLEQMDASEIYAKRLNAKEVSTPISGEKFIFPIADWTVNISENIHLNPGQPRQRRRTR